MSADRRRGAAGAVLTLIVLLSGCASMPADGNVNPVEASRRAEYESRVRVYGVSPQKGEGPKAIVRGFLEATTSDEPRFTTAKEYLTDAAAESWDPFARTTVIEGGPTTREVPASKPSPQSRAGGSIVQVSGRTSAVLNSRHVYDSEAGRFSDAFHLTKVKGEGWRIDRLSDGVVLGESDFERIYRSVDNFYFARLGPDAASVSRGENVLVAQPVYVRSRIHPVAETVRALLAGPDHWLSPVVTTAFPEGTRPARGESVTMSDSAVVTVRLNTRGVDVPSGRCKRMAAQVLYSVQSQASAQIASVSLKVAGADCELTHDAAEELYAPGRLGGGSTRPYFIDDEYRVATVEPGGEDPKTVPGPLGSGALAYGSVGVSRDERRAAAVSLDGTRLFVHSMSPKEEPAGPVLTSAGADEQTRLSAPSWDGQGDLWVADRDPRNPRLLRLRGGTGPAEEISVPALAKDERIAGLRVSSDGVRIALRILNPDGSTALKLGRVVREGTRENPSVSVAALQPVAPQLEEVVSVSWAGHSELLVVGRESRGVQQPQYVGTDGSTVHQPSLPGINDVKSVAASQIEGKPVLAESKYGIVRLPADESEWETVTEDGSAPVYPG
jgi:hypothetical protein